MIIKACSGCGKEFESVLAPCPDGREGCCVAHYDDKSFLCPHCGHDAGPAVSKALLEGGVTETLGVGIYNPEALKRLKLGGGYS